MKNVLCMMIAVGGIGCASSSRIERAADRHEARAAQLEAAGDTTKAAKERDAAAKQHSKANSRRGFESAMPVVFH